MNRSSNRCQLKLPAILAGGGNYAALGGVQMDMGASWTRMQCCAFVSVTMTLPLAWSRQQSVPFTTPWTASTLIQPIVTSTPIEKALDELRVRFPTSIVIGFEELYDPRPDREPEIDLGPKDLSLKDVLNRVRSIDPRYRVELLQGSLIHVYPASETADPVGLLDIRLRQFVMPQDSCLGQAIEYVDEWFHGYAPELIQFLAKRKDAWYREHGREVPGMAGDILGNCISLAAPGPMYRNITVRDALNLMARRSLRVSRGEVAPNGSIYSPYKPLSWKFRFRREPDTDSGLGGVPLFQTF